LVKGGRVSLASFACQIKQILAMGRLPAQVTLSDCSSSSQCSESSEIWSCED